MDDLTTEQVAAVAQLRELTNGSDEEVAVNVLRSVDWDVERAADLVFGGSGGVPPPAPETPVAREEFEIDDTEQGHVYPPPQPAAQPATIPGLILRPIFSILSIPFSLISGIFRFIFGVLRIPFPNLNLRLGNGLNFYSPLGRTRPTGRGGADKWIRELEEETGAVSMGRLKASKGVSSGVSSSGDAGPSGLTSRGNANGGSEGADEEGRRVLPDFVLGTYEEALKTCQREIRIGCIILVSEEHDDVAEFKRSTLTDPAFVKSLQDHNVLVWGGDVRDVEAWSAAEKLQATTYPFVAFLALQPKRTVGPGSSTSRNAPPSLTVLSRHQGPSIPSSSAPTSASTLTQHLETQVIPRVTSYLDRLRAQQRERERDRELREEQDRAFRDAARRDTERIQRKMEEDRVRANEARQREEERNREEERARKEEEERKKREEIRMDWRRWTRRGLKAKEEQQKEVGKLRVAMRLPSGERVIKQFAAKDTLTTLYASVDANLIPTSYKPEADPEDPPQGSGSDVEHVLERTVLKKHASTAMQEYWGFKIASAFPRGVELGSIQELKGGGQVVVEWVGRAKVVVGKEQEDEEGYETESSEEED
ncbi:hypothetical protein BKA70DRAFT_1297914 [Coprinopsis sp. MPI-PUGE-AT-0042]|nr:hypothetical protein BKA70DRAFT_1297914 [Coprinopsis sp. MPI-PUGE-AT-0042]